MPKPKKKPGFGSPKTPNPVDEMLWCFSKHIYVTIEPEAIMDGRYWKQTGKYAVKIRQGKKEKVSEFKYNVDDIVDAVHYTYVQLYEMNYGKETKEQ